MTTRHTTVVVVGVALASAISSVSAGTALGAGVWANYRYVENDERDEETFGDFADEALILYADGHAPLDEGKWSFSAEMRIGPGSFTRPASNSTGDSFTLHKAWVGWSLNESTILRFGKSQVPFGWKTVNFWPGDLLQAGYGDQMDVGVKLSGSAGVLGYEVGYYHADDWGETSTDTVDDNGHWGSPDAYRKVQTVVGDVAWNVAKGHTVHLSVQQGRLQDLTGTAAVDEVSGDHVAYALWYEGTYGPAYLKAEYMAMERDLPPGLVASQGVPATISNQRAFAELGFRRGEFFFYLDASIAMPDTEGNDADNVTAFAPGFSYDYGPGWVYVEYLTQDGFVDANGQVGEGDFDALYLSADFYL